MTEDNSSQPDKKKARPQRRPLPAKPAAAPPQARTPRPPRQANQAQWGYAKGPNGELIIRNWYFAIGDIAFITVGIVLFIQLPLAGLLIVVPGIWALMLEMKGVQIHEGNITYPVRLGLPFALITELPPLFMRTLPLSDVSNATTATIRNTTSMLLHSSLRVAHLTGEFGAAKIVLDSKAGRDRLFAILRDSYPHIKVYRWT